jgi:hypothetical protein
MAGHAPEELRRAAAVIARAVAAVSASGDWSIDLPDPPPGTIKAARSGRAGDDRDRHPQSEAGSPA